MTYIMPLDQYVYQICST